MTDTKFDYAEAFKRNLGWITAREQEILRGKRVAIAGLGGVGGDHLITLTRLGVGKFSLAEFDTIELANFNRQACAHISTIGQPKIEVMAKMARDINPNLDLRLLTNGLTGNSAIGRRKNTDASAPSSRRGKYDRRQKPTPRDERGHVQVFSYEGPDRRGELTSDNIHHFLDGVDLYIDGLDFFVLDQRRRIFQACRDRKIPAMTTAPLGMGAAHLNFMPRRMSFEDYFRFDDVEPEDRLLQFLIGLAPRMLHRDYLADWTRVNFAAKAVPSTAAACKICAGVATTEALKILLNRPGTHAAPHAMQFDAYNNTLARTYRFGGNRDWRQKLTFFIARGQFKKSAVPASTFQPQTALEKILDQARWAPSPDNAQPWRFKIISDEHCLVYAHEERDFYDRNGFASQIAHGALLENIQIAASAQGYVAGIFKHEESREGAQVYSVEITQSPSILPDPLACCIQTRSVQRRVLSPKAIPQDIQAELKKYLPPGYSLLWMEERKKIEMAKLITYSGHMRLSIPEGIETIQNIIEWGKRFSVSRIPDRAAGADPLLMKIWRWAVQDKKRIQFLNKFCAGTVLPCLELDFLPGLFCGAYIALVADTPPQSVDDQIRAGAAIQRFWLAATLLGLQHQPTITPLIFARYAANHETFSTHPKADAWAAKVNLGMQSLLGGEDTFNKTIWLGRLGFGKQAQARSLRLPLEDLIIR